MNKSTTSILFVLLTFTVTGCLPSSCNRVEPRAVAPADSVSRALAATLPVDTLEVVSIIESEVLSNPRTVMLTQDGGLIVSDSQENTVHWFDEDDVLTRSVELTDAIPYLAGLEGDSVWVYAPGPRSMFLIDGSSDPAERGITLGEGSERALTWVARTQDGFVSKVLDEDSGNRVAFHGDDGAILETIALDGPAWRWAGFLRAHQGAVYSLAGFLPSMDVIANGAVDSVRFVGFDSPMLARTLQFQMGSTDQPPLLSASSAFVGERIFLLNMRPGWLHIDVYGLDGSIQYILTQPDPSFGTEYYPTDLAVVEREPGVFDLAVTITEPAPRVDRFRWRLPQR